MEKYLRKDVYKNTSMFTHVGLGPFGLRDGQCLRDDTVHNGRWFNGDGEYLGWGDLSKSDIRRIMEMIQLSEMFVVLYESDDEMLRATPEDVKANAFLVIAKDQLYSVLGKYDEAQPGTIFEWCQGVNAMRITRDELRELMS